jgi:hypothetical protein
LTYRGKNGIISPLFLSASRILWFIPIVNYC